MERTPAGSINDEDQLLVPIRMVESLQYCPRQAWYRFTLGDDPLNLFMERGLRRHERLDAAAPEPAEGDQIFRHLPVSAPRLGVYGVIDEVTIGPAGSWVTEYKTARTPRIVWAGVAAQVMVQALALREHAAGAHWLGPDLVEPLRLRVYFSDSRRYRDVPWTAEAERAARAAVDASRTILKMTSAPPGNVGARCSNCQHEPICLPFDLPAWLSEAAHAVHSDEQERQR